MRTRAGGILLHITSLPSPFGIGDLGPGARSFIDFLARTGQAYWQFLPLNPTDLARHNSPYVSDSAFAGNPLLISPEGLVDMGFLHSEDIDPPPGLPEEHVDYEAVAAVKSELLGRAFERFEAKGPDSIFERYCAENAFWLEDFARFAALKHHFEGLPWDRWPEEIRRREPDAMGDLAATLGPRISVRRPVARPAAVRPRPRCQLPWGYAHLCPLRQRRCLGPPRVFQAG
jgi:4-alpha-glucanotransferase